MVLENTSPNSHLVRSLGNGFLCFIGNVRKVLSMKKVRAFVGVGLVGCTREEEFEFEDDTTDEEIEEEIKEWIWTYVDYGWNEK